MKKTTYLTLNELTVESTKSFLIIEDNESFNEFVVECLMLLGFNGQFFQTYKLKEAKEIIEKNKIDFIICDWNLPDGEGFTLLKAIRKLKSFNEKPFLMMTGNDDVEYMLKNSEHGGSEFLVKPFEINHLKVKLVDSWKHHMIKNEDYIKSLEKEVKRLKSENFSILDENERLKKLLKGLS